MKFNVSNYLYSVVAVFTLVGCDHEDQASQVPVSSQSTVAEQGDGDAQLNFLGWFQRKPRAYNAAGQRTHLLPATSHYSVPRKHAGVEILRAWENGQNVIVYDHQGRRAVRQARRAMSRGYVPRAQFGGMQGYIGSPGYAGYQPAVIDNGFGGGVVGGGAIVPVRPAGGGVIGGQAPAKPALRASLRPQVMVEADDAGDEAGEGEGEVAPLVRTPDGKIYRPIGQFLGDDMIYQDDDGNQVTFPQSLQGTASN